MQVYTDGCCNKALSGWAVVCPERKLILRGDLPKGTTNQQAELGAIIQSLYHLGKELCIYTDSKYCIGCFTQWLNNWQRNGWRNAKGNPVANKQLIELGVSLGANQVNYVHVRGHAGIQYNEMADYYCKNDTLRSDHIDWTLRCA